MIEDNFNISYEEEIIDDTILNEIRNTCFVYLSGECTNITLDELYSALEFINEKFEKLFYLRKSFKMGYYNYPFLEISKHLDKMTLDDDMVLNETIENIDFVKEVNYTIDNLKFCYGIINKMINEEQF